MASDIIDFQAERGRHESLLGREDVMAELDAFLLGGASRGWALVKGGPGMGKSALLAEWLKQRERAGLPVPPHHFLRRGVEDWDRAEVVKRNLVAQVEKLYPELADSTARPESSLRELLQRVSDKVLKPRNERLVLVVDGLDEVEAEPDGSNPLTRFLPHVLPSGVKFLCASKPMYHLSWLEAREGIRTIDLDGERWAGSNKNVVRQYWEHVAPRFVPPLAPAFVREAVQRAEGNVLYAVKLTEWLQEQSTERRRAELLPRGLEALLDESWGQIQQLPGELRKLVIEGLGVVAVAREALPLSLLVAVAQWKEWEDGERFLRVARSFLLEESGHERGEKTWRPFHESFRNFILSKLGHERVREEHRRLAECFCRPPVKTSDQGFRWSYALRHGVTHWLKAGQWEQARGLYTNVGYLKEKCRVAGVLSLEDALLEATVEGPEDEREIPSALVRAVQAESHHLRTEPGSLPLLVYNRLRSSGWAKTRIEKTLCFPDGLPALRLRHPVKTGGNARTLEGHEAGVNGCAVTPDGRHVVSASEDGSLKVWELETGRAVVTLEGHGASVNGCAVTPDGRHVVSASWDKTLKVWEWETGREVATLEGHDAFVQGCVVTPDGRRVVSAYEDGTLKVWEWETGHVVATLEGHEAGVNGCAVTPDGRHVVSASGDRTLKVWELETGREVATLRGHKAGVNGCAVTPDGRHVVSVSWNKTKVWEWGTGRVVATLEGHGDRVAGCAVTPDGRHVLLASEDRLLKVWEWKTGRVVAELKGHGDRVNGCAVTPDGQRVVSASGDKTLKVWEWETGPDAAELEGHGDWVSGCVVMPDGRHVVSASSDGTLKVWELETGRVVATLEGRETSVNGCVVTPDGRHVMAAFSELQAFFDGILRVWEWETGQVVAELKGHKGSVTACAVTPDGRHVVTASSDRTLKVWEWETGRVVATLEGHGDRVTGCAVTPDGRHVVSASQDRTLRVWEWETGRAVVTLEGHEDWVNGCVVTPDGRHVVSASQDRTLKVWEWKTGREVATLEGHGASVDGCAVTPDGRHVVSASQDRTLKVWVLKMGRCLHTLHGVDAFLSVASTPHVICAGDALGNVWIVETESEVPRASPAPTNTPSPGPTMSVSFPKPVLEAYRSHSLALFIGSGLSLGRDVKGDLPTWSQLPHRLLDACERLGSLDARVIQDWRNLFKGRMSLEFMLAQLGSLRAVLGHDYPKALDAIFRPSDAAPGSAHHSVARLGVRAILTTNYDSLIEEVGETPRRQVYTWRDSDKALRDLESGRNVLLKVHGTAEHHDTVVMTELEYHKARSDSSYQTILSHLLKGYTFLFIGYGMNDPLDLDLVLKWNMDAFRSAARGHYALLKDPSDNDRDRYERAYNIRVIPYNDHAQLPAILEELQRVAAG